MAEARDGYGDEVERRKEEVVFIYTCPPADPLFQLFGAISDPTSFPIAMRYAFVYFYSVSIILSPWSLRDCLNQISPLPYYNKRGCRDAFLTSNYDY